MNTFHEWHHKIIVRLLLYDSFICVKLLTHTHNHFTALWILSGTTWVSRYQKKHSPTHTYRGHQSFLICVLHLLLSVASSCSVYVPDNLFHNLPSFLRSTSWPGTLNFILHTCHPIIVFFSLHMPIPLLPVCCSNEESVG